MTVVINMHKPYFIFKTYVMSVLCTPLQVKCYRIFKVRYYVQFIKESKQHLSMFFHINEILRLYKT